MEDMVFGAMQHFNPFDKRGILLHPFAADSEVPSVALAQI
jgi:hypothetical protein